MYEREINKDPTAVDLEQILLNINTQKLHRMTYE